MKNLRIKRPEARVLAEMEFMRTAEAVASLSPEEWAMPTDCTGWDVRKLVLHVLGSGDAQASVRQFMHQFRKGLPLSVATCYMLAAPIVSPIVLRIGKEPRERAAKAISTAPPLVVTLSPAQITAFRTASSFDFPSLLSSRYRETRKIE